MYCLASTQVFSHTTAILERRPNVSWSWRLFEAVSLWRGQDEEGEDVGREEVTVVYIYPSFGGSVYVLYAAHTLTPLKEGFLLLMPHSHSHVHCKEVGTHVSKATVPNLDI